MDEQHKALLDALAQAILGFQDAIQEENNPVYAEAIVDLQKVFAYLYMFGGNPNDSDSNGQE